MNFLETAEEVKKMEEDVFLETAEEVRKREEEEAKKIEGLEEEEVFLETAEEVKKREEEEAKKKEEEAKKKEEEEAAAKKREEEAKKWEEEANKKVLQYGNVLVTKREVDILKGTRFLNDIILEFYFLHISNALLQSHESFLDDILLVSPALSFFLQQDFGDDSHIKDFAESNKVASKQIIMFTVNNNSDAGKNDGGSHWSLLVYYRKPNTFVHYDSLGTNSYVAKKLYRAVKKHVATPAETSSTTTSTFVDGHMDTSTNTDATNIGDADSNHTTTINIGDDSNDASTVNIGHMDIGEDSAMKDGDSSNTTMGVSAMKDGEDSAMKESTNTNMVDGDGDSSMIDRDSTDTSPKDAAFSSNGSRVGGDCTNSNRVHGPCKSFDSDEDDEDEARRAWRYGYVLHPPFGYIRHPHWYPWYGYWDPRYDFSRRPWDGDESRRDDPRRRPCDSDDSRRPCNRDRTGFDSDEPYDQKQKHRMQLNSEEEAYLAWRYGPHPRYLHPRRRPFGRDQRKSWPRGYPYHEEDDGFKEEKCMPKQKNCHDCGLYVMEVSRVVCEWYYLDDEAKQQQPEHAGVLCKLGGGGRFPNISEYVNASLESTMRRMLLNIIQQRAHESGIHLDLFTSDDDESKDDNALALVIFESKADVVALPSNENESKDDESTPQYGPQPRPQQYKSEDETVLEDCVGAPPPHSVSSTSDSCSLPSKSSNSIEGDDIFAKKQA